jgi:Domain of unknown function (DUF4440)
MDNAQFRQLEEGFWQAAGDPLRYAKHLSGDVVHVFPGWGIVERDPALEGVRTARPWQDVVLEQMRVVPLGKDGAAVVYEARARRSSQGEYTAAVTSVYRREGGHWRLVIHQQTPLGGTAPG